ncbi:hypothetical protein F5882DRAFT_419037 [Hyaloscypha sp. PMI_1271]|nr:hypothetical protein F5882DRAFT_419037 [Hyaloscypha sp. PMI_1271]
MRDFADKQSQLDYEASPERFFFEEGIRTWVVWRSDPFPGLALISGITPGDKIKINENISVVVDSIINGEDFAGLSAEVKQMVLDGPANRGINDEEDLAWLIGQMESFPRGDGITEGEATLPTEGITDTLLADLENLSISLDTTESDGDYRGSDSAPFTEGIGDDFLQSILDDLDEIDLDPHSEAEFDNPETRLNEDKDKELEESYEGNPVFFGYPDEPNQGYPQDYDFSTTSQEGEIKETTSEGDKRPGEGGMGPDALHFVNTMKEWGVSKQCHYCGSSLHWAAECDLGCGICGERHSPYFCPTLSDTSCANCGDEDHQFFQCWRPCSQCKDKRHWAPFCRA